MSVPGIGPIISSAMVAAIGTGDDSPKAATSAPGSDWCPSRCRRVTARFLANIQTRQSLSARPVCQAAWVVIKPKSWERHGLKPWIEAAKKRLHRNVLAIALANKLARIAWSVLAHGRNFEARKIDEAAPQSA